VSPPLLLELSLPLLLAVPSCVPLSVPDELPPPPDELEQPGARSAPESDVRPKARSQVPRFMFVTPPKG
jgi:hypothetical protein